MPTAIAATRLARIEKCTASVATIKTTTAAGPNHWRLRRSHDSAGPGVGIVRSIFPGRDKR